MVIHGKVKTKDIVKAVLSALFWTALSCYHYVKQINTTVLIFMIAIAISGIYDTVFVLTEYHKQRKQDK